jgi:hypothetical protein
MNNKNSNVEKLTNYAVSYPWLIILLLFIFVSVVSRYSIQNIDIIYTGALFIQTFGSAFILKKKLNLDKKDRTNRTIFLLAILSGWLLISLIFIRLNISWFIIELLVLSLSITITLTVINVYYRISFHTALNTSLMILLNHIALWLYWPLFLLIPIIAWTRLVLKKHTLLQVILGAFVPFGVYFIIKLLFLN